MHDALRRERDRFLARPSRPGEAADQHKERAHKRFFAKYDQYLDTHRVIDWLARPEVAEMIRENLFHHNGVKYYLLAYCIMPNHVHVLFQPADRATLPNADLWPVGERADARSPLAKILHSLKSFTANRANELLGRAGQFWQHESYDHWIRDDEGLGRVVDYIVGNPANAGVAEDPLAWRFSSAHDRFAQDGDRTGLLSYPK